METSVTSPGFALLRVGEISRTFPVISYWLVEFCNDRYLSSVKYRNFLQDICGFETYGPCASGTILQTEFDFAFCLHSPLWPKQARRCKSRLYSSGWPSHDTLKQTTSKGCNVVPIGSKTPRFRAAADLEWRISFSLAENSLIQAMNHHQFLCYGLLKIFLNEVIKETEGIDDLLCSYFLKTAMFWEMTETRSDHINCNILYSFWNCFRRIISWVKAEYCPNFFIPENNMFSGKIYGQSKELLLQHLIIFYKAGYL